MFKVGDRVKCIDNNYDFCGNYGIITKLHNEGYYVMIENTKRPYYHNECDIKLVEPQYTWTSKFNIGDKVVANDIGIVNNVRDLCISNEGIWYTLNCGVVAPENMLSLYKEPTVKEMTVGEVEKELGYTIKIIKEEV